MNSSHGSEYIGSNTEWLNFPDHFCCAKWLKMPIYIYIFYKTPKYAAYVGLFTDTYRIYCFCEARLLDPESAYLTTYTKEPTVLKGRD